MAFYVLPEYTPTDNEIVNVAEIMMGDQYIKISCFPKTGTLFMNGLFAPKHLTIGESLEWYLQESVNDYEIQTLFFQKDVNDPRHAHAWERASFLQGHWRAYAKNNIRITATFVTMNDDYIINVS